MRGVTFLRGLALAELGGERLASDLEFKASLHTIEAANRSNCSRCDVAFINALTARI